MTFCASSIGVFTLNFSSSFVRIKWRTGAAVEMSRAAA